MSIKSALQWISALGLLAVMTAHAQSGAVNQAAELNREISCNSPIYPPESLSTRESGTTVLGLLVGPTGAVEDSKIVRSSGSERLDQAAKRALVECKFKPEIVSGQAVKIWVNLPVAMVPPASVVQTSNVAPCPSPEYPEFSLRNKHEGVTVLSVLIGLDGSVQESKVKDSSGFGALDEAARNSIRRCKFKPAIANGAPSWVSQSYTWSLKDKGVMLRYDETLPSMTEATPKRASAANPSLQDSLSKKNLGLDGIERLSR